MNTSTYRHAGEVIADRLAQMGKKQTWLANECEVSNNAVSKWIQTGKIGKENIRKVAEVLELELATIAPPEPPPSPHFQQLLSKSSEREREVPNLYVHITQAEFNLLQAYRRATLKSRLILEVVASNAEVEETKSALPFSLLQEPH